MMTDRYGHPISTNSTPARDAYVEGLDLVLSAGAGVEAVLGRAIAADDGFALPHIALARAFQVAGRGAEAQAAVARARALAEGASARERSQVDAVGLVVEGKGPAGLAAIRAHLATWPRDALVLQPCTGVFGLIGFSGRAGREAELLDLMRPLATHYGDDWWFGSVMAFAEVEAGETARAVPLIERSLAQAPRNAHGAHIRAHVYYEAGETEAGLGFIRDWLRDYEKAGGLHCHIAWHVAIWALETGRGDEAWAVYRDHVAPGGSWGPPLNTMTDSAAFLFRAELAGEPRKPELWREVSAYAAKSFPNPGIGFADAHAALAHAMAGDGEALAKLATVTKGAAADMVRPLARAFAAFAAGDWAGTIAEVEPLMATHERIGGSRAQRDLIEYTLLSALLRSGRADEARRLLSARRPAKGGHAPVNGLN